MLRAILTLFLVATPLAPLALADHGGPHIAWAGIDITRLPQITAHAMSCHTRAHTLTVEVVSIGALWPAGGSTGSAQPTLDAACPYRALHSFAWSLDEAGYVVPLRCFQWVWLARDVASVDALGGRGCL